MSQHSPALFSRCCANSRDPSSSYAFAALRSAFGAVGIQEYKRLCRYMEDLEDYFPADDSVILAFLRAIDQQIKILEKMQSEEEAAPEVRANC